MIKLYLFESADDLKAYEAREVIEKRPTISLEGVEPLHYEREPKLHYKKAKTAKPTKTSKQGRPTCGNCGKPGHNSKTCTESKSTPIERVAHGKAGVRHCKNCGKPGHRSDGCPEKGQRAEDTDDRAGGTTAASLNPDELQAEVRRLQEEGLTSIQIASRLKTNLMTVNRYWDADIAENKGHEEEDEEQLA